MTSAITLTIDENFPGIEKSTNPAFENWYVFKGDKTLTEDRVKVAVPLIVEGNLTVNGNFYSRKEVCVKGDLNISGYHWFKEYTLVKGNLQVGKHQHGSARLLVYKDLTVDTSQHVTGNVRCLGNQVVTAQQTINGNNYVNGDRTVGTRSAVAGVCFVGGQDNVFGRKTNFVVRLFLGSQGVTLMSDFIQFGNMVGTLDQWQSPSFDNEENSAMTDWNKYGPLILSMHKSLVEIHSSK